MTSAFFSNVTSVDRPWDEVDSVGQTAGHGDLTRNMNRIVGFDGVDLFGSTLARHEGEHAGTRANVHHDGSGLHQALQGALVRAHTDTVVHHPGEPGNAVAVHRALAELSDSTGPAR